jgi:hypothetical protein
MSAFSASSVNTRGMDPRSDGRVVLPGDGRFDRAKQACQRLRRIKAAVGPDEVIRVNHPVPPAQ